MSRSNEHLPPLLHLVEPQRLVGSEPVVGSEDRQVSTLLDFWAWSASDLLGNVQRGLLAEYIVSLALGCTSGVRASWDPYDAQTKGGVTVEVKSASYVQQWAQRGYSTIQFQIPQTTAWNPHTNRFEGERRRQAQVYVFALLAHKEQETINPLDTRQWKFFVLSTAVLDDHCTSQKSVGLARLQKLGALETDWKGLARTVGNAATLRSV